VWLFLILKKSIAKARKIHSISTLIYITPFMLRTNTCFLSAVNKGLHISILSRDRGVGIYVGGAIEQENKKASPLLRTGLSMDNRTVWVKCPVGNIAQRYNKIN